MKTVLVAILISLGLLGTPISLVSAPVSYACGTSCGEEETNERVPGWAADCGATLACLGE